MSPESFENLRLELRRGCLVVAVLAALREEQYGYTLRKALAEHGIDIDEGTLYPLLRRLETQGLLSSEWREHEKRNKRFYRLSKDGDLILQQLVAEWRGMDTALNGILQEHQKEEIRKDAKETVATKDVAKKEKSHGATRALPASR
jgi:PadR family transcriptional regulator, regulatory protein PadR